MSGPSFSLGNKKGCHDRTAFGYSTGNKQSGYINFILYLGAQHSTQVTAVGRLYACPCQTNGKFGHLTADFGHSGRE